MKTVVISALALLVVCLGSGIWAGFSGAPYSTVLINIHKLSGILSAVLVILYFRNAMQQYGLIGNDLVLAIVFLTALVVLLITGAIACAKQQPVILLQVIHSISAAALSLAACWKLISYLAV